VLISIASEPMWTSLRIPNLKLVLIGVRSLCNFENNRLNALEVARRAIPLWALPRLRVLFPGGIAFVEEVV
jgi:hypothetical protein